MSAEAVTVTEVRVLEGPNLYFARPAIKVSLECPGYLAAQEQELRELGRRLGLRGVRPGAPDSDQRQRFLMRLVAHVVRLVAHGSGTTRLAVRTRTGGTRDQVVVAFPWRWRGRGIALGESLGTALGALVDGSPPEAERGIQAAVALVAAAERGARPVLVTPRIPVASITGTNGKTTTTRLLAHIGMTAGLTTAWSSTDGVLVQGRVLEDGDYSGPAGARAVLAAPGVQLGILETARGGMLLKGMGVSANDVSVVTNVSADHLGLQGIDTVDQLAEVKAIVTRATKPAGWVVLNGDDPRVWAMRAGAQGRPWAFSLDPDSPALREALNLGGRAATVLDGDLVVLSPDGDPDHLVPVVDVPVTLSGLSEHNIANALAAAAAALGLGLPREAVVEGLRTFAPDPLHNPGRMNVYSVPAAGGGDRDGRHRPGPQRGRPGGAAAGGRGAAPAGGGRAPRPGHRRRPHRRDPAGARRAGRPAGRPGHRGAQGALPARSLDGRPRGAAADRAGPGGGRRGRVLPERARGAAGAWWPPPVTATCWR